MTQVLTYRYRIKDKHAARLSAQAAAVNMVWNFCNETQKRAVNARRPWLGANDLGRLCSGATKEGLDLSASTVETVCRSYDASRRQRKLPWLRWRGKRSLGWIPFRATTLYRASDGFRFRREDYGVWLSREIPAGAKIGDGCFSQDRRGRWFINIPVTLPTEARVPPAAVGVDLGLKTLAACSDGRVIAIPAPYRRAEAALATAQRANKKGRVLALHAKIANQRRDYLHKASRTLANEYGLIVVGNISPSKLARTKMAKSIYDAGWSDFRRMIEYKAIAHGSIYLEVDEAYTSRTCSHCHAVSGPKGIAGLGIREWQCECGAVNDRDVNAAQNILALGHERLAAGIAQAKVSSALSRPKKSETLEGA